MLKRRVIPCLDVKDGRVVKGVKFQGLRDAGDPVDQARRYAEEGADELVILDVSATPEGRGHAVPTVEAVRAVLDVPLTVGGGVRSAADAEALLSAGADKVAVNSAAVARPELLTELASRFGVQCTVLALDAALRLGGEGWETVVRSGRDRTGLDAVAWAAEAERRGAGEILLTSWDRDGTGAGYDLALLRNVRAAAAVPIIASGGAAHSEHLAQALEVGADAVLAATIFHDSHTSVGSVKADLAGRGLPMRGAE
ncbi:MAG: imidazole glycerol phosphate synthase subunit HisF [Myxococcota bacterium]